MSGASDRQRSDERATETERGDPPRVTADRGRGAGIVIVLTRTLGPRDSDAYLTLKL